LHGWLAAVIPADAQTFRVSDEALAETLVDAGAELSETAPDVEIVGPHELSGDATHAIVMIDASQYEGGSRVVRAARRLGGSLRARVASAQVRRRLRAHGYGATSVVLWDVDQLVHLPDVARGTVRRRLAEHLPQRALVIGSRLPAAPTVLEAVAEEAAKRVGRSVEYELPLARQGLTIALAEEHVLRIAIGPGRLKIELLRAALDLLSASKPTAVVTERVPWLFSSGRLGLADWSVERRLPGSAAPSDLTPRLLEDCIDFLVALHAVGGSGKPTPLSRDAGIVAAACRRPVHRDAVLELGRELDSQLGQLPRGFGHGDFWTRNLVVEGDRLTGVIDWDAATPDRLPLLDLLHLLLSAHRERTREYLGAALVRHQLPWARAGGDDIVQAYCRRLEIDVDSELLEALVLAYWLNRVGFELSLFADRAVRPIWMHNNVHLVLETLAGEGRSPG
jgi:aminoglycoside phosphotransferase (APT) family kinase protein